jgi:hypothetical protein
MAPSFLTSALDGGVWSASPPTRFTTVERAPPPTHWMGGRADPKVMKKRKILLVVLPEDLSRLSTGIFSTIVCQPWCYVVWFRWRLRLLVYSKEFWRWCVTQRITGFLDSSHRPVFYKIENRGCPVIEITYIKGAQLIRFLPPLTWGRKQIQLQKRRVFCFLEYRTMEKVQKPNNSIY